MLKRLLGVVCALALAGLTAGLTWALYRVGELESRLEVVQGEVAGLRRAYYRLFERGAIAFPERVSEKEPPDASELWKKDLAAHPEPPGK
jgi:hypothetical protein